MAKSAIRLLIAGLVSIVLAIIFTGFMIMSFLGVTGYKLASGGFDNAMSWAADQVKDCSGRIS